MDFYLGVANLKLGKYDEALGHLQNALAIREKILSPDDPELLASIFNMGCVYERLNDNIRACEYYQRLLVINQRTIPLDDPRNSELTARIGIYS